MTNPLPSETQPAPPGVSPHADATQAAGMLERNKTVLFDALAAAGISEVIIRFDGYSDSGQIEDIEAWAGLAGARLPDAAIVIAMKQWDKTESVPVEMSLADAIEHLAYALLAETHSGWENNDGAYGEFIFEVAPRSITLGYNERFTTSDYHQHVF